MTRSSGVLLHISSLWGEHSEGGFGKAASEWIDFLSESGFTYWQVLPFCLPDKFNSPYSSYSAFSLNPFFIDLPDLYDRGLLTADELRAAKQKTPYSCEFDRLWRERLPLLSVAAKRFETAPSAERAGMDAFFAEHPHTAEFCRFMALKKANAERPWQEWDVDVPDENEERLWRFSQYIFYIQWKKIKKYANDRGVKIIGDVPIYVSADSADVWAAPGQFCLDEDGHPSAVAGVPPDYFCADGQLWGNPLYDWDAMRRDGFLWWRQRAGFMTELFDGMRIDHFRGLESYFSIPAGEKTAKNGKWMRGPGMELVRAIREACGIGNDPEKKSDADDFLIIAEDLGDITDDVRRLVDESGFPGMRVLQFGFLGDASSPHLPHNYPAHCVAYTGTHDNNTLLGYVWEQSDDVRRRLMDYCGYAGGDWNACYDAVLRTMFASHADLLILPLQDLLLYGSDTRFNTPGKSTGNWSYRVTKEQICGLDAGKLRYRNELYGRK